MKTPRERHFTSLDFGKTSVFSSNFPVDLSNSVIRRIAQRDIPNGLDNIFMFHGCDEIYETVSADGAIALSPISAEIDLHKNTEGSERRKMLSRSLIYSSLTDDRPLSAAHIELDMSQGIINGFSLAATNDDAPHSPTYEVRGFFADPAENGTGSIFDVTKYLDGKQDWSLLVDEAMAADFVGAVEERRTREVSDSNLRSQLMGLVDASNDVLHRQSSTYDTKTSTDLTLSTERKQRIRKKLAKTVAKTVAWSMNMQEKASLGEDRTTIRTFTLNYDTARTPRYQAQLGYLITDDDDHGHKLREPEFEEISNMFRDSPEIVYEALARVAARLQSLDSI